jgi:hypothetical protein
MGEPRLLFGVILGGGLMLAICVSLAAWALRAAARLLVDWISRAI